MCVFGILLAKGGAILKHGEAHIRNKVGVLFCCISKTDGRLCWFLHCCLHGSTIQQIAERGPILIRWLWNRLSKYHESITVFDITDDAIIHYRGGHFNYI